MDYFEKKIKFKNWCPRILFRYVDDYFAIIKRVQLDHIQKLMNDQIKSIDFAVETEENGEMSHLDLKAQRKGNKIAFDIFRKPTNTGLFIKNDSFHHQSHKAAAFHLMIYRLINIPLDKECFKRELKTIYEIADSNGYHQKKFVERTR